MRMDRFEKRVSQTIRNYGLLSTGDRILVAISGGPDSIALLMALYHLRETHSLELLAAHINHQLRGEDSEQDEIFVRDLCEKLSIAFHSTRLQTRKEANKATHNLEDFARRQRYRFLFQIARQSNAIVATGHNLNDQTETFFMKLVRGAGLTGLSGIYPERENTYECQSVKVVRPLLETPRAAILAYLSRQNQDYRLDTTNEDLSLERNWVRHHLIPVISEKLNPGVLHTVGRTAQLLREMEELLIKERESAFGQCAEREGDEVRVSIPRLQRLPTILQKEVVRLAIRECCGNLQGVSLQNVEDTLGLTRGASGRQVHLPGDLKAQREFEELRFLPKSSPLTFCHELTIPGRAYVKEVGKHVIARRPVSKSKTGSVLLRFKGDRLQVRNRLPGDRYRVSPRSPSKKLKKIFLEWRLPRSKRDKLLVLVAEDEIVWVEGFPSPTLSPLSADAPAVEIEVCDETSHPEKASK